MILPLPARHRSGAAESAARTIWGCTPRQVHDRFWAAFGVEVVRRGEPAQLAGGAELYLLAEPGTLVLVSLSEALATLYWTGTKLLVLRLTDSRPATSHESAVEERGRLVRFQRIYRDAKTRTARIGLTPDVEVARRWQSLEAHPSPWRALSAFLPAEGSEAGAARARVYDERDGGEVMQCLFDVMGAWERPEATIPRAQSRRPGLLADPSAEVDATAVTHGQVLVGARRRIDAGAHVVGPAVLWDETPARLSPGDVNWLDLEPASLRPGERRAQPRRDVPGKRLFDVAFALGALAVTLPLYPVIAAAILVEDGRPVFFAHRRESRGGREFPCLKFRSMRRDADRFKASLAKANQADGPQFFIENDPRVTRVGRILRRFHFDELPQFWNVLVGHMSVVGPRPSPYRENQYCPAWREARLSVRPGVTGLWQVMRTRRRGLDFQEWIKFDLEYVANAGWRLDLRIIAKTLGLLVHGGA